MCTLFHYRYIVIHIDLQTTLFYRITKNKHPVDSISSSVTTVKPNCNKYKLFYNKITDKYVLFMQAGCHPVLPGPTGDNNQPLATGSKPNKATIIGGVTVGNVPLCSQHYWCTYIAFLSLGTTLCTCVCTCMYIYQCSP